MLARWRARWRVTRARVRQRAWRPAVANITSQQLEAVEKKLKGVMDELKVLKSAVDRKVGFASKKKAKSGDGEGSVD
jgi:hypothetical protein